MVILLQPKKKRREPRERCDALTSDGHVTFFWCFFFLIFLFLEVQLWWTRQKCKIIFPYFFRVSWPIPPYRLIYDTRVSLIFDKKWSNYRASIAMEVPASVHALEWIWMSLLFCCLDLLIRIFGAGKGDHIDGSVVPPEDSTYIMTKEHAAAFKKVPSKPEFYSAALLCFATPC